MQNDKLSNHISAIRQIANEYKNCISRMRAIGKEWDALYNTLIDEDSFVGENESIILSGDPLGRVDSVSTVISNFGTIITDYDAGINTNFERVTS